MTKINNVVNDMVEGSSDVQTRIMTPKEAVSMGALALFGEKYGEEVRVVFMGKENNGFFSTELCGGTHVKNTKEVGKFKVISQSSIASGIRRVEALRDKQLENYEKSLKQDKSLKEETLKDQINGIKNQLLKLKIEPSYIDGFLKSKENKDFLDCQIGAVFAMISMSNTSPGPMTALSYFIGENPNYSEDTGFALKNWKAVRWENTEIKIFNKIAIANICIKVLNFAKLDTGNLISFFAINSLKPDMSISLVRIIIAAITS